MLCFKPKEEHLSMQIVIASLRTQEHLGSSLLDQHPSLLGQKQRQKQLFISNPLHCLKRETDI